MSAPPAILDLPYTLLAPALAREFAAERTTSFDAPVREIVQLLVSEIATNAVLHGGPPVRLSVSTNETIVRVEVQDRGSEFDTQPPSPRGVDDVGGWGLGIVATLATTWGVSADDAGKSVWFEVDASTSPGY